MLSTTYSPRHAVDLVRTLRPLGRGTFDPTMQWESGAVWRTMPTPEGTATLYLRQRGAQIDATAWGDGERWAIAQVPELCGHGDDDDGFDVSANPFLRGSRERNPGLRIPRTGLVLEMLIAAVIEQKVTGLEARRAWVSLLKKYGAEAPGPAPAGMRVFPSAEVWRMIPSWEWHRAGVGPDRSKTAVTAASVSPGLERTMQLGRGGPEVEKRLRSVQGVGVWTANETMVRAHGDPDAVSVGDYHLPALVGWALVGEPVDDDGMLELLAPWAGHRARVMRLIETSGFAKPRFGARMTVQDHRSH
jgi:3-methyladenine DNA glycosylase/8-oxoguanine DNA glycosylase